MKVILKASVDVDQQFLSSWLRPGKEYVVLSIEQLKNAAAFRLASENEGQPVLFEVGLFDVSERSLAKSWVALGIQEGIVELGPEEFASPSFLEQVFDHELHALITYRVVMERILIES